MVRKYKTTTVKPAAPKLTPSKENKIKVAIMNLKLTVGSQEMTFKSPLAEQILAKVKHIVVGREQVQYFDKTDNKFKSFTYCCGDKYEVSFTTEERTLQTTEVDCYKFPITYEGDK